MKLNSEVKYNPCLECLIRRNRFYSEECDSTCEYASEVKNLKTLLEKRDVELQDEKSRVAKLIARNAKLDYDLGCAYELICKLKGE